MEHVKASAQMRVYWPKKLLSGAALKLFSRCGRKRLFGIVVCVQSQSARALADLRGDRNLYCCQHEPTIRPRPEGILWVKMRKAHYEQMFSGLPSTPDIGRCDRNGSFVPKPDITKQFEGTHQAA
jgi:hypothetical protein